MDYRAEKGAKRNFEPWRDASAADGSYKETEAETLDRLEREEGEEQEQMERDKMAELEEKMHDSKREMAIADALDEIRTRNARIEKTEGMGGDVGGLLGPERAEGDEARRREEEEDEEAARRAFMTETGERVKRLVEEEGQEGPSNGGDGAGVGSSASAKPTDAMPPPPSFARTKKPKKPLANGLGIKKKAKPSLV